jgi:putative ABC transport system substrate-binding protein
MNRKIFCFALGAMLFAFCSSVEPQQPKKVPRIAYLAASPASANAGRLEAFRQGLRDIGYVEGENIVIEDRYADGKFDRLPALAAELVRLKFDVIITAGPPVTRAVKEATATIPVVMAQDGDPVGNGLSPALRDLAGTLRACHSLPRR